MRILIPLEENKGKDSKLSWHFGRARYFAIYDTEKDELKIVESKLDEYRKVMERPVEVLLKLKPDVVFAKGIGPRALDFLTSKGIEVMTCEANTLRDVIERERELKKLSRSCKE